MVRSPTPVATTAAATDHYGAVAVILHWVSAVLIIATIPLGLYAGNATGDAAQMCRNLHKGLGIAILALSLLRILWRLTHRPPALPLSMARPLRLLARVTQAGLYFLLLALPLSGWVMSSAVPKRHPIGIAGVFEVPFLPIGQDMGLAMSSHSAHVAMAWTMIALLALHIAGALKHHFYERDGVLKAILPLRTS